MCCTGFPGTLIFSHDIYLAELCLGGGSLSLKKLVLQHCLCSTRDTARRGNPMYTPLAGSQGQLPYSLLHQLEWHICSRSPRNGHTTPATQITTLHIFAQEKAGDWGGAGRKKLGRVLHSSSNESWWRAGQMSQCLSASPKHLSRTERWCTGDISVPQKNAGHREELLLFWLVVSCSHCFWDSEPRRSFRHSQQATSP